MTAEHEDALPFLRPMTLERIVSVLKTYGDSITQSFAAAWLLDNVERATQLRPYAVQLVGEEKLRFDFGNLPRSVSFSGASELRPSRFGLACDRLFEHLDCTPTNHRLLASLDPQSLVTRIVAEVDVDSRSRPPSAYRRHSDPRGWETHASLFFKTSRICRLEDGDFATIPNPPDIGKEDYDGLLLEHVSFGFAPGFPMEGLNVLTVGCRSQDRCRPNFHVSLYASLEMLLGLSFSRGGLDVDSGEFIAEAGANGTHLRGTKVARFSERQVLGFPVGRKLNLFAPLCLAVLMSVLIFAGACYDAK
jgi:hypothetical protein